MAHLLGGKVVPAGKREFGFARLKIRDRTGASRPGSRNEDQVWMSHGDKPEAFPEGFKITASTSNTKVACRREFGRRFYGVQFHPEVIHTKEGKRILGNFLFRWPD